MPLPEPKDGETEKQYIPRCMEFQSKEGKFNLDNEKDRKQALAICYNKLGESLIERGETIPFKVILNSDKGC